MSLRNLTKIEKLDDQAYRSFGLTFAAILLVLFGLLIPWLFSLGWPLWPWVVAIILAAMALLKPSWLWWVYKPWMIFWWGYG